MSRPAVSQLSNFVNSRHILIAVTIAAVAIGGCRQEPDQREGDRATPVYNKQTGRLEELLSDKNGDGKIDTRAHMARAVRDALEGAGVEIRAFA